MEKENSIPETPDWINVDFLKKILFRDAKDATIESWKIEMATTPGDNYASVIYRICVDLGSGDKVENKSFIMKVELTNQELSRFVSEGNAFGTEIKIYTTVIPQLYKILRDVYPNDFQPFAPKCFYTHLGPPGSVIIFEDLKKENFRLAERSMGLDMKHTLLVVRTLAKYHASSTVLPQEQPDIFQSYKRGVYQQGKPEDLKAIFVPVLRNLAEELKEWPGYEERFSDKLLKIADKSIDLILEGVETDEDDFNVLAHEDVWLNNMMFRYSEDTGEVTDLRLLDFQACHWVAAAVDIQRYLFSTATAEVVEQHEFILKEYYKTLHHTLNLLGYQHLCPTIDHLKKQMDRRAMFGIILGIGTRAFFLADRDNFPDINKVMRNEEKVIFSKLFKDTIRDLLPVLEKNNWI